MSDLKGILELFAKKLYGEDTVVRFRPHHFPFTEPSAEMDIQCYRCHGEGCPLCKGEGWIEILGCGMVHSRDRCCVWSALRVSARPRLPSPLQRPWAATTRA